MPDINGNLKVQPAKPSVPTKSKGAAPQMRERERDGKSDAYLRAAIELTFRLKGGPAGSSYAQIIEWLNLRVDPSKKELNRALPRLVKEGILEKDGDTYRLKQ